MRPPLGPGGPGAPPPGPGFGPPPWPGPGGFIGDWFGGLCSSISTCFYALCCCWLLQDCFGGPFAPPGGPPFAPRGGPPGPFGGPPPP